MMMKLFKSIVCISILMMLFSGCASADELWNGGITIGVAVYDAEDEEALEFRQYLESYIGGSFEAEFLYNVEAIDSAEDEIAFIEQLHEQGAQGVISLLTTYVEEVLPVCEEYGMYYICGSGTISDEVYERVKDHPYFLGTIGASNEEEQQAGEWLAESMAALDTEKNFHYLVVTGGSAAGNEMHRLRTEGILSKLQEVYGLSYDMSIEELAQCGELTEIETGSDVRITLLPGYLSEGTEVSEAVSAGDYDAVLSSLTIGDAVNQISEIEREEGRNIRIGMVDCFTDENSAYFNETDANGDTKLNLLVGKYGAVIAPAFAAIYNACSGYAEEFRDDGSAFRLYQSYWYAQSTEEFDELYALSIGMYENVYSAADMLQVLKAYNPEADFQVFAAFTQK
ncbi:MAG: hypothetical protein LUG93_04610 [Lachnospiraceae bacterium]|nr:hypothetical protein [Lachnospiraceae bacterium]